MSMSCRMGSSGEVDCTYAYHPGKLSGPPEDCYPAEEEWEVGKCDACGTEDWSAVEDEAFYDHVANGGDASDDGPDEDDRDDWRDER